MTRNEFDQFCKSLKSTTHVVQWHGTSVWKVGGKIFALAPLEKEDTPQTFAFKASDFAFEILTQQPGIKPSPYLARAKWIMIENEEALSDEDLKSYITEAHEIIAKKLTKKQQKELGLV